MNKQTTPKFQMPLGPGLVGTLIKLFCQKPIKGDDKPVHCSLGVAENSLVATDGRSAILIGQPAEIHVATERKDALLEVERAKIYGDPVDFESIERNCDAEGEAQNISHVQHVIAEGLNKMVPLASVDPDALLAIGKAASDAGALSVQLLQDADGDPRMIGFKFSFLPEADFVNLFNQYNGEIPACGVFRTLDLRHKPADNTPEFDGKSADLPKKERTKKPKKLTEEPEPEIDDHGSVGRALTIVDDIPVDTTVEIERHGLKLPALEKLHSMDGQEVPTGEYASAILKTLDSFGLPATMEEIFGGPAVTRYELSIPTRGVKVQSYSARADDLQLHLGVQSVRVQAPIPGKSRIGIEVPNKTPRTVPLRDLCARQAFVASDSALTFAVGLDIAGKPVYGDLTKMPHLLIAGATNSGKSIGIASILASLLLRNTPRDMRLVLIDPKRVELTLFDGVPHLLCPVITDVREAAPILRALCREMDRRYELLSQAQVRNIDSYNAKVSESEKMTYIVTVIDELADLMLSAKAEVETAIVRLTQMARAVGMHLVIATQRPSVDVITGLIKANVPSRIAYAVASMVDSRVVLDEPGAEKLLGRGDMLYSPIGSKTIRLQGGYVSEDECRAICDHWIRQEEPIYQINPKLETDEARDDWSDDGLDDFFADAGRFAIERGQCSTSMLQRRFSIGFQRASRILDQLEEHGVVGPRDGPRPREVLMDIDQFQTLLSKEVL